MMNVFWYDLKDAVDTSTIIMPMKRIIEQELTS